MRMDTIVDRITSGIFGASFNLVVNRFTGPGKIGIRSRCTSTTRRRPEGSVPLPSSWSSILVIPEGRERTDIRDLPRADRESRSRTAALRSLPGRPAYLGNARDRRQARRCLPYPGAGRIGGMIACYTDRLSLRPGERFAPARLVVRPPYRLEIACVGAAKRRGGADARGWRSAEHPTPAEADRNGCGWPVCTEVEVGGGLALRATTTSRPHRRRRRSERTTSSASRRRAGAPGFAPGCWR